MISAHLSGCLAGLGATPGELSAVLGDEGQGNPQVAPQGPEAVPAAGDGGDSLTVADVDAQPAEQPAAAAADNAAAAAAARRPRVPRGEGLPAAAEDVTAADVTAELAEQSAPAAPPGAPSGAPSLPAGSPPADGRVATADGATEAADERLPATSVGPGPSSAEDVTAADVAAELAQRSVPGAAAAGTPAPRREEQMEQVHAPLVVP